VWRPSDRGWSLGLSEGSRLADEHPKGHPLSNLGRYQDIVSAAAEAGSVDNLIKNIEDNAVSKSAPRIFLVGAVAATAAWALGTAAMKHFLDERRARELLSNEAKEQLRAVAEYAGDENDSDSEDDANDSDLGDPV